tara:strand:- start:73 stop:339 length:267 start_codon:yes stop_codon:yes gene_type:complete
MISSIFGWSYPAGCSGPPDDDDPPEKCPSCDKANYDEEAEEWVCPEAQPFCSAECEEAYNTYIKELAASEAYEQAKHDKLMLEVGGDQ